MTLKNISKYISVLMVASAVYGCKDTVELPNQPLEAYNKIYMPQAVDGPVSRTLKIKDTVQAVVYGANFGGRDYPTADIPVSFSINKAVIDSFNLANKTSYLLLPEGTYTMPTTNAVIGKGQLATAPLSISFKTTGAGAIPAFKTYILPVSISSNAMKVNEALRTTFFIVKSQPDMKDYPNYNRTNWKVVDFSSQEANGEGQNNGRCVFTFDGDNNTFWHSQWQGGSFVSPHYMTIDMGEMKSLHGLSFLARQNDGGGKFNEVNVQISEDNMTWTNAGTFNLQNNKNLQPKFLEDAFGKNVRYFKVTVKSAYDASYTHLAELYAF